MYQVRYTPQHAFSQALRILFPEITNYVDSQLTLNKTLKIQGRKTSNIKIPENMRCSIAFYTTENPNVWEAFRKFPILGCHLLDGCLLAPV